MAFPRVIAPTKRQKRSGVRLECAKQFSCWEILANSTAIRNCRLASGDGRHDSRSLCRNA